MRRASRRRFQMNPVVELKSLERQLRDRIRDTPVGEFGALPGERSWVLRQLTRMREAMDAHIASVPASERRYEEYRLEFILPLYTYLSRAYEAYYCEAAETRR
jgi:hypothetical protein